MLADLAAELSFSKKCPCRIEFENSCLVISYVVILHLPTLRQDFATLPPCTGRDDWTICQKQKEINS